MAGVFRVLRTEIDWRFWRDNGLPDMPDEDIEAFKSLQSDIKVCTCGCNGCRQDVKEENDGG